MHDALSMRIQRSLRSNHSLGKPEEKGSPAHRLELGLGQLDDAGFEFRPVVALVFGVAGKVAKELSDLFCPKTLLT